MGFVHFLVASGRYWCWSSLELSNCLQEIKVCRTGLDEWFSGRCFGPHSCLRRVFVVEPKFVSKDTGLCWLKTESSFIMTGYWRS